MTGASRGPGTRRSAGPSPARRQRESSGTRARAPVEQRAQRKPAGGDAAAPGGQGKLRASLTGRAAVLALVLGVLAVSYAYPLRAWYDQHRERNALRDEVAYLEASVAELEHELRLWDDPAFVRAQARERLGYVLPGEVGYIVVDETGEDEFELGPDGLPVLIDGSWYTRLWTSLEAADRAASGAAG